MFAEPWPTSLGDRATARLEDDVRPTVVRRPPLCSMEALCRKVFGPSQPPRERMSSGVTLQPARSKAAAKMLGCAGGIPKTGSTIRLLPAETPTCAGELSSSAALAGKAQTRCMRSANNPCGEKSYRRGPQRAPCRVSGVGRGRQVARPPGLEGGHFRLVTQRQTDVIQSFEQAPTGVVIDLKGGHDALGGDGP
jgi:hypothetical protein